MVKLSEILKDWPEKRNREAWPSIVGAENHGYNTALTSCDREVDKEALVKQLNNCFSFSRMNPEANAKYIVNEFISTMPTWLKSTERK